MRPIVTRVAWSVCVSVSRAISDEPSEMPFGVWKRGAPKHANLVQEYALQGVILGHAQTCPQSILSTSYSPGGNSDTASGYRYCSSSF